MIQREKTKIHDKFVDAVGFNCGIGPGHMHQIIKSIKFSGTKLMTALPNAGYPQIVSNRFDSYGRKRRSS